jgi:hypothetical protein
MDLYPPGHPEVERRLKRARRFNRRLDRMDRKHGFAPPSDAPLLLEVRTVLDALFAAIATQDWDTVCEASALLQDHELRMRQMPQYERELRIPEEDEGR